MKKYTIIIAIFISLGFGLSGCIGSGSNSEIRFTDDTRFPSMTGIDLNGQDRQIPKTFSGEYNIIAIGFEREHQKQINTWIPEADAIMATRDDVKFYEVPLIYELNAIWRTWINNGMRSGIQNEIARERTITVYTDREQFTSKMDMDLNNIYVLLLDREGNILCRTKGALTPQKLKSLKNQIK